jgi:FKBP-type peptidyl-prolyl cis-trans isomerase
MGYEVIIVEEKKKITKLRKGNTVRVHYTGTLENGKKFDSSRDRGKPFDFKLGIGQVIRGWDEGLIGLYVGGKYILNISSDYGYGNKWAGSVIPPNSNLIFDIEIIGKV